MITIDERIEIQVRFEVEDYPEFVSSIYDAILPVQNDTVIKELKSMEAGHSGKRDFLLYILSSDITDHMKLPISKASARKMDSFSSAIKSVAGNQQAFEAYRSKEFAEQLAPLIFELFKGLPMRLIHSFELLFKECGNSVLNLYYRILSTPEEEAKYPILGKNHTKTVYNILHEVKDLIDRSIADTANAQKLLRLHKWASSGIPANALDDIRIFYSEYGYFPLFKVLNHIIESFSEREYGIVRHGMNIYSDIQLKDMATLGQDNSVTRERIRQLRLKLTERLRDTIISFSANGLTEDYHYDIADASLSARESIPFNGNFIRWVLSHIEKSYTLVGDYEHVFYKYPATSASLHLIPNELMDIYDFEAFIEAVNERLTFKRFEDESILLTVFMEAFHKSGSNDVYSQRITDECIRILEHGFNDIYRSGVIVFPQNARKNIPDLIEDIIREHNGPMSASEICDRLNELYPELKQERRKIGANALTNPKIIAISRTGTYTLKEWDSFDKRGGTLRELVDEYLENQPEPIASLDKICEYISLFRSNVKQPVFRTL